MPQHMRSLSAVILTATLGCLPHLPTPPSSHKPFLLHTYRFTDKGICHRLGLNKYTNQPSNNYQWPILGLDVKRSFDQSWV
ncbi:hypothetical protein B0H34DRAFT_685251 [Crassisporium funariophilum]|nr:hypothetical protein B0H34DRAFT_685251 [Crassisporium funariophilum]